jgi:hypothetical protein
MPNALFYRSHGFGDKEKLQLEFLNCAYSSEIVTFFDRSIKIPEY